MASSKYIVILTSSMKEYRAVREQCETWSKDRIRVFRGANFSVRLSSYMDHSLVVICSLKRGSRIGGYLLQSLIHYQPSLVLFSGVAGGVGDEVSLGTVVMSGQIVDLTLTTEDENGTTYHPEVYEPDGALEVICQSVAGDSSWTKQIKAPSIKAKEPIKDEALVGTIGSSYVLVKTDDAPLLKALLNEDEFACAIEMESAACVQFCQSFDTPYVAIRGISDFRIDKSEKTDIYRQPWAAAHASAVAFEVVRRFITDNNQKGGDEVAMGKSKEPEEPKQIPSSTKQVEVAKPAGAARASEDEAKSALKAEVKKLSTMELFNKVSIRPSRYRGTMFTLRVAFKSGYERASEEECKALGLDYGDAVTREISLLEPAVTVGIVRRLDFVSLIYAQYDQGDWLEEIDKSKSYLVVARFEYGDAIVRKSQSLKKLRQRMNMPRMLFDLEEDDEPIEQTKHFGGLILQKILDELPLEESKEFKPKTESTPSKSTRVEKAE